MSLFDGKRISETEMEDFANEQAEILYAAETMSSQRPADTDLDIEIETLLSDDPAKLESDLYNQEILDDC